MKALEMKERTKTVALTFSLLDEGKNVLRAKQTVNCDCKDGKLKTGFGWTQLLKADGTPQVCDVSGVEQIRMFKVYDEAQKTYAERFCVLTEDGEFFIQEDGGAFESRASGFAGAGIERLAGENLRYRLVLIGESGCAVVKDDGNFDLSMLGKTAKTGCFFKHRMFVGLKPSALACSAPENELDFTESLHDGGTLRFPNVGGEIVAIKPFGDDLYLFFEYGILCLKIAGAFTEFSATELEYAGGKIYGRTVVVGNRGVYFLAADGAYRFDGEKVERLLTEFTLPPKTETRLEKSAAFDGRILLRYGTENGDKTLVIYEDGKDGFYMDELPVFSGEEGGRCLFIDQNGVICVLNEEGDFGLEGKFFGAETDFGVAGRKTLTKLRFEGKGSFSLTVKNGGRTLVREVTLKDGVAEVKLSERGERFAFDLLLPYGAEIAKMSAELKTVA